jgi:PleD family two-component response regulator
MSSALVIDDNRQTAEALVQILKLWDINARISLNPSSAMLLLEELVPNIVFLDINMPGVDGFEVLGFLKREPRLMGIPVIIVTSDDQPETARRAMDGGAAAIVIKPVMIELVEEALKKIGLLT